MIDLKGYSEIKQVPAVHDELLKILAQRGWRLLGVDLCADRRTLNKNFPYMSPGNNYPSTHSYVEEVSEPVLMAILGLPTEAAQKNWSEQIGALEESVSHVRKQLDESKPKLVAAETEAAKYKEAFTTLEARFKEQAAGLATQLINNHALSSELAKLKAGMSHLVSKVGGASLAELQEQDKIEEEIKKAAEVGVAQ